MSEPDVPPVVPRAPDHRVALGASITLLWLVLGLLLQQNELAGVAE
jgi:hypothetical protein